MENINFTDLISNAIIETAETICSNLIDKLEFDKTIKCTIVDDTEKANGKYKVSDGSTSFMAEADNKEYEKDTQVYVYVINNDLSENKIIIGQVHSEKASEAGYLSPIERMIILDEKKIIPYTEDGITTNGIGLLVNDTNNELLIAEDNNFIDHSCQYSTFGIAANFDTSTLGQNNIYSGDYGIRIILTGYSNNSNQEKTVEMTMGMDDFFGDPYFYTGFPRQEKIFDILLLDKITGYKLYLFKSGDFISADESIDLTYLSIMITDLSIFFGYSASQYNETTPLLYTFTPEKYDDSNKTRDIITRFIQKTDDSKIIYNDCEDLKKKIKSMNDDEDSSKMALYWYRYNPWAKEADPIAGDYWSIMSTYNDIKYRIKEETVTDDDGTEKHKQYLESTGQGIYNWDYALDKCKDEEGNLQDIDFFTQQFDADENRAFEKIKLVIVYSFIKEEQGEPKEGEDTPEITYSVDTSQYESNELRFDSKNDIKDIYLGLVKDFTLSPTGSYNGLFLAYDDNGNLQKTVGTQTIEASIKLINPGFNSQNNIKMRWFVPSDFTMFQDFKYSGNKISMAIDNEQAKEGDKTSISADWTWADKIISKENGGYWTDWLDPTIGTEKQVDASWQVINVEASAEYQIKKYYTPQNTNNKIICQIDYNGCIINKEIQILFGQSGNSGTSYTLTANLGKKYTLAKENSLKDSIIYTEDNVQYEVSIEPQFGIMLNNTETYYIELESQLYDFQNNLIDISESNLSWSFYKTTVDNEILNIQNKMSIYKKVGISNNYDDLIKEYNTLYRFNSDTKKYEEFSNTGENNIELYAKYIKNFLVVTGNISDPYAILQVSIEYDGKILTSYIPLGFYLYDSNFNINEYIGITNIIYNNDGANPIYYKNEHYLKNIDGEYLNNLTWKVEKFEVNWEDTDTNPFFPMIEKTNDSQSIRIRPCSLIVENILGIPVRILAKDQDNKIIYSQSVLIQQNAYGNQMLNEWDGSLQIDQENNTILSAQMAAGIKNEDNTFTGVLMGKVKEDAEISFTQEEKTGTGLFGYFHGLPSFGFDSDGSAFIGQYGKGRIIFNPKEGEDTAVAIIQSENFKEDSYNLSQTSGSQWNLTNSSFKLYGDKLKDTTEPYSLTKFILNTKPDEGKDFFGIYVSAEEEILKEDETTEKNKILIPLMSIQKGSKIENKEEIIYEQGEFFLQSPGYYFQHLENDISNSERINQLRNLIVKDQFYYGNKGSIRLDFKKGELIAERGVLGSWAVSPEKIISEGESSSQANSNLIYSLQLNTCPPVQDLTATRVVYQYNSMDILSTRQNIFNAKIAVEDDNWKFIKNDKPDFVKNGIVKKSKTTFSSVDYINAYVYIDDYDQESKIWTKTETPYSAEDVYLDLVEINNNLYIIYKFSSQLEELIADRAKALNLDIEIIKDHCEFYALNPSIILKRPVEVKITKNVYEQYKDNLDTLCNYLDIEDSFLRFSLKLILLYAFEYGLDMNFIKNGIKIGIKDQLNTFDSYFLVNYLGNINIKLGDIGYSILKDYDESIITISIPNENNEIYKILSINDNNDKNLIYLGVSDSSIGLASYSNLSQILWSIKEQKFYGSYFDNNELKGIDLGDGTFRWNDLYLFGGIYLGQYSNIYEDYVNDASEGRYPLRINTGYDKKTGESREYVLGYSGFYINKANGLVDLGSATYKWKDLYLSGIANIGSLSCTGNATVGSLNSGSATITDGLTLKTSSTNYYGYLYYGGGSNLHTRLTTNSNSDTTYAFGPSAFYITDKSDSDNIPSVNLGTPNKTWANLYLSGTANIGSISLTNGSITPGQTSDTTPKKYIAIRIGEITYRLQENAFFNTTTSGTIDLGTSTKKWRNLYLSDSIYGSNNTQYTLGKNAFYPSIDGTNDNETYSGINLGSSNNKWAQVYAARGTINTSDIRFKDIQNERYLLSLLKVYDSIDPIAYKWKNISENENHDRIHIGLKAQQIEEKMFENGLTRLDFGGLCIDPVYDDDGNQIDERYSLRYGEFHGLHILKNHLQDAEMENLKQQINSLNDKLELLQEELNQLKNNN